MKVSTPFRKKIWIESFLATCLVYFIIWLFYSIISTSFEPFNFISKTIEETQLTDLYFSKLSNNEVDTNIVLVNIGSLTRPGIALLVDKISRCNPKAIALDIFFSKEADTAGTAHLKSVISDARSKLIMTAFYLEDSACLDPQYIYFPGIDYGHSNFITNEERTLPVRSFYPSYKLKSEEIYSFAAETARKVYPEKFDQFVSRHDHLELINYKGDEHAFRNFSYEEILAMPDNVTTMLYDKIIIVGFLRAQNCDLEDMNDMFFTPVNKNIAGRSFPDMCGAVINANILSMILSEQYILQIPSWIVFIISFIIIYLHIMLFLYFASITPIWYFPASKFLQLVSVTIILLLVFILFKHTMILFTTKYLLIGLFFSPEIVLIYEAIVALVFKYFGYKSILIHQHIKI